MLILIRFLRQAEYYPDTQQKFKKISQANLIK